MTPVPFDGQNVVFAKDQPQYLPLPARIQGNCVTSCWRPTFFERVVLLLRPRLYIHVLTFGGPLQPILPSIDPTPPEGARAPADPGVIRRDL